MGALIASVLLILCGLLMLLVAYVALMDELRYRRDLRRRDYGGPGRYGKQTGYDILPEKEDAQ